MLNTGPAQDSGIDTAKTSLEHYFAKERAILDYEVNPLAAEIDKFLGIPSEMSREIDRVRQISTGEKSKTQFGPFAGNWKGDPLNQVVADVGDPGAHGELKEIENLGYIKSNLGDNNIVTSNLDRVNALPYGLVGGLEPGSEGTNGLGKVTDFIPFKFKDAVNNK